MDQPDDPNLNALWCRAIAEELHRSGVDYAVLCPGSRNSPLLHALHRELGQACLSHVDERSAGFIALGLAKAGGTAVAVCVTSGSAAANLLPALTEARAAGLALVVVSADRPWEAQRSGAPQTMPQIGMFGDFVVDEAALGEPICDDRALRALRARCAWLVRSGHGRGPVHLNVPLREPLPPLPDPQWSQAGLSAEALRGRANRLPYVSVFGPGMLRPDGASLWTPEQRIAVLRTLWKETVGAALVAQPRGLIIAGPASPLDGGQVRRLAEATGFPVIADAPGPLRWELQFEVVSTADAVLGGPLGETRADLVIQLGSAPLARATYEYLDRQTCPVVVVSPRAENQDFLHRALVAVIAPDEEQLRALAAMVGSAPASWRRTWQSRDAAARAALIEAMRGEPWGEVLAAHRAVNHQGFALLHLASSMAVRHGNLHLLPGGHPRLVTANRGVNGIDGTIGTFIGELIARADNGLLLIGDLAFLHDLPALAAARQAAVRGAIVVLNNDGGGIFDFLALAAMPDYHALVRTPQGLDYAHAAAQFGLGYALARSDAELRAALDAAAARPALTVIECDVRGGDTVARHRALIGAMAAAEPDPDG